MSFAGLLKIRSMEWRYVRLSINILVKILVKQNIGNETGYKYETLPEGYQ